MKLESATSVLVTDVGNEMCWRQLWDVGYDFGRFCHQHSLSFNISFWHQQPKDVTNIEILSLTFENCHQDKVTNIYVADFVKICESADFLEKQFYLKGMIEKVCTKYSIRVEIGNLISY